MRFFLSALLAAAAIVTAPAQAKDNNCSGEGQRVCKRGAGCDAGLEPVEDSNGDLRCQVPDSGDGDDPPICGFLGAVACPVPGLFDNGCESPLVPDFEGFCSYCGKNGEPPCDDEDGCGGGLPGFVEVNGICENCGGFGEPACLVDDLNESACEGVLVPNEADICATVTGILPDRRRV